MKFYSVFTYLNLEIITLITFLSQICIGLQDYHFDYLSYDNIIQNITNFTTKYPEYIRMYNITEKNITFPPILPCGAQK